MNALSTATAAALLAAAATVAVAQTPAQAPQSPSQTPSTDPSAASSPHQRQATDTGTNEAAATNGAEPTSASSPHQQEAMKGASRAETGTASTEGATPQSFVNAAAQDGMEEVELAKLAQQKSSNGEVKQFAQRMEQDHTQANQQLESIARTKGLQVPTKLDTKHDAMVKQMSAKSGASFDRAYAEHMAKDHDKAISLFQSAAQSSDADLASFAKKTLSTLEEHKQLADNLHSSVETRTASAPGKEAKKHK